MKFINLETLIQATELQFSGNRLFLLCDLCVYVFSVAS